MDYIFILFILFDIIYTLDFVFKFIKKKKEEHEINNQIERLTKLKNLLMTKRPRNYTRLTRKERLDLIKKQKRKLKNKNKINANKIILDKTVGKIKQE